MEIKLEKIKIKDLYNEYENDSENGVSAYGGKLDIRPKYQREFVYNDKQRNSVIETVKKDFPLNVMYWVKKDDGNFEVLDGQQRSMSICEYLEGNFSVDFEKNNFPKEFHNLEKDQREKIENYELMVYFCEGDDSEKLEWFKTINIAGEELTSQELRNAVYSGTWLSDAKKYFSKTGGPAFSIGQKYLKGSANRQEYLETAIKWINNGEIEKYMSENQNKDNANELWIYFQEVISWIQRIFPKYRKEMKGLDWGILYNKYKDKKFNSEQLEKDVEKLMMDDEVSKKSGIYIFLITGDEKYLSLRAFSDTQKREVYEKQNGICPHCKNHFEIEEMDADHITPWSQGGKTDIENCQMLCRDCNRRKSDK